MQAKSNLLAAEKSRHLTSEQLLQSAKLFNEILQTTELPAAASPLIEQWKQIAEQGGYTTLVDYLKNM